MNLFYKGLIDKMFDSEKQCYAPVRTSNGMTRCTNNTIDGNKIHCFHHYDGGIKSYKKYKKICSYMNTFDLNKVDEILEWRDKISFLNTCYDVYIKGYEARKQYRDTYIVPEYRDYGHCKQFTIIKAK